MITKSLLNDYKVGLLTIMIRKSYLNSTKNVFDTNYDLIADFDFAVKFSLKYKFDCIQEPVAIYRIHENQMTKTMRSNSIEEHVDFYYSYLKNNNLYLLHKE